MTDRRKGDVSLRGVPAWVVPAQGRFKVPVAPVVRDTGSGNAASVPQALPGAGRPLRFSHSPRAEFESALEGTCTGPLQSAGFVSRA